MTNELILAMALVAAGFSAGVNYASSPLPPELPVLVNLEQQIDQLEQALRASCPTLRGQNGQNQS